ncbi:hypothetical protein MesoLjLc_40360 [Mesorhizobium sp. L-8-10]|nr:hypothetical protein MesoLjLc_40360 [Mesorhizobium sp. L-8-10]
MESKLKSPFTGEAARPYHEDAARRSKPTEKSQPPRKQRLILSATGMAALAGLGALAALFTAPFADPPAAAGDIRAAAVPAAMAAEDTSPEAAAPRPPAAGPQRDARMASNTTASGQVARAGLAAISSDVEALEGNDPRWAKTLTPAHDPIPAASGAQVGEALAPTVPAASAVQAALAMQPGGENTATLVSPPAAQPLPEAPVTPEVPDETRTAAITPDEPAAEARPAPRKAPAGAAATGAAPSSTAVVTSAVKMRARAANGATVVAVIPDNASVGIVACKAWCEVVYKGRRGFVYKGFVGQPSAQAQPQKSAENKPKIVAPTRTDPNRGGR